MKALVFLLTSLVSYFSYAQTITFNPLVNQAQAGKVKYNFNLVSQNKNLTNSDLNITHEKVLHFIAYDQSLTQFQHVHPEFDGKSWNVDLEFAVNGDYKVWVQGETKQGGDEFSIMQTLSVTGGATALPAPTALGDVRTGVSGVTQVELSKLKLKAGKMAMLDLMISQTDGNSPNLAPYLGAFAHVIAVPLDGSELLHVHPMDGNTPNMGMLHTEFPNAGDYRLWVQLSNNGEIVTVPLSVTVSK